MVRLWLRCRVLPVSLLHRQQLDFLRSFCCGDSLAQLWQSDVTVRGNIINYAFCIVLRPALFHFALLTPGVEFENRTIKNQMYKGSVFQMKSDHFLCLMRKEATSHPCPKVFLSLHYINSAAHHSLCLSTVAAVFPYSFCL